MVIMLVCSCKLVDETLFSKKNFMKTINHSISFSGLGMSLFINIFKLVDAVVGVYLSGCQATMPE